MKEHFAIILLLVISTMLTLSCSSIISSPRQGRLSLADPKAYYYHNDIDGHPGTYSYGYDVVDPTTGNNQFRTEERYPNGTVVGSYGYIDSWGRPHKYKYIADARGYRVVKEPIYKPYIPPNVAPSYNPSYPTENSVTWTRPKKPYIPPNTASSYKPSYPTESSVTWTRPKKPYKKKHNNYIVNRPNFIGRPSSYVED